MMIMMMIIIMIASHPRISSASPHPRENLQQSRPSPPNRALLPALLPACPRAPLAFLAPAHGRYISNRFWRHWPPLILLSIVLIMILVFGIVPAVTEFVRVRVLGYPPAAPNKRKRK